MGMAEKRGHFLSCRYLHAPEQNSSLPEGKTTWGMKYEALSCTTKCWFPTGGEQTQGCAKQGSYSYCPPPVVNKHERGSKQWYRCLVIATSCRGSSINCTVISEASHLAGFSPRFTLVRKRAKASSNERHFTNDKCIALQHRNM
jgi:hypothetical protein